MMLNLLTNSGKFRNMEASADTGKHAVKNILFNRNKRVLLGFREGASWIGRRHLLSRCQTLAGLFCFTKSQILDTNQQGGHHVRSYQFTPTARPPSQLNRTNPNNPAGASPALNPLPGDCSRWNASGGRGAALFDLGGE